MQELFSPPQKDSIEALHRLYPLMRKVLPLKEKQYKALPRAVQELSYTLTQNRSEMPFYWSSPAMISAYFYYFMPWNWVRFSQLLPNLQLPEYAYMEQNPSILDIGSGTLTLPIALWLFRKDLRELPLTIYCLDTARKPMEYGRALLQECMKENKTAWKIVLLDARKREKPKHSQGCGLVFACNVGNEIVQKKNTAITMEESIYSLYSMLTKPLAEGGHAVCIEVGTRLGGKITALLHNTVIEEGECSIIAPCTHTAPCPYAEEKSTTWCHFSFADFIAPEWLQKITLKAHLEKTTLSTSLLHIAKSNIPLVSPYTTRVLSAPIRIQETGEFIRYACTQEGIVALEKAKNIIQGTALTTRLSIPPRIDEKSKAPFVQKAEYKK